MRYLCLFMLGCIIFGCTKGTEPSYKTTSFVVIGDRTGLHLNDSEGQDIHCQVLSAANQLNPEFGIVVGDMIEGYTENSTILELEWREYFSLIDSIDLKLFFVPGNHDLFLPGQLASYKKYAGEPYYSFNKGAIHFVFLDNSRWDVGMQLLDAEQYNWLKADLEQNKARKTFIFCHIPFWNETLLENSPQDSLHQLFLRFKVAAVFAGHYHNYFQTEYDGISYVIAGRAGGGSTVSKPAYTPKDSRYTASAYEPHRFIQVEVNGQQVVINNFPLEIVEEIQTSEHRPH